VVSAILLALAFLCPLTGAAIGMVLRHRIPEHHLTLASIDVMKLAMGLMATLIALTLGLLIQSAKPMARAHGRFASMYGTSPPAVSRRAGPTRTSDRRAR
jgi:hypothetical protein